MRAHPTWWWRCFRRAIGFTTARKSSAPNRDAGVGEYWIVDPRADAIEVFVYEAEADDYVLLNKFEAGDVVTSHVLSGFEVTVDEVLGN